LQFYIFTYLPLKQEVKFFILESSKKSYNKKGFIHNMFEIRILALIDRFKNGKFYIVETSFYIKYNWSLYVFTCEYFLIKKSQGKLYI